MLRNTADPLYAFPWNQRTARLLLSAIDNLSSEKLARIILANGNIACRNGLWETLIDWLIIINEILVYVEEGQRERENWSNIVHQVGILIALPVTGYPTLVVVTSWRI